MNRPYFHTVFQVLSVIAAGWAGWVAGRLSLGDGASAVVQTVEHSGRAEGLAPHQPARAPGGWSPLSWPAFSKPDLSKEHALTQRAYEDPEVVMNEVMTGPVGSARNEAILFMLRGWVARDPVAAAEWLAALDPLDTPGMPLADVEPIFWTAPAEARAKGVLGFLAAKAEGQVLLQAAEGSSRANESRPKAAPGYSMLDIDFKRLEIKSSTFSDLLNARTNSLAVWASQEPEEALAWVRARPVPEARLWLMNAMVGALARNGAADQAIELYNAEPDLHEQGAVRSLGKAWALADPAAALAWSDKIPDPVLRDQFIGSALRECPIGQAPELLEFTSSVGNLENRRSLREHLVNNSVWNQAAVHDWIESDASLNEAEREHLRVHLKKAANRALQGSAALQTDYYQLHVN